MLWISASRPARQLSPHNVYSLQEDREVESELSSEEDLHNVEKHATDAMTKNVNKSEARLSFTSSRYVIKLNFPKTNIPFLFINIAKRC